MSGNREKVARAPVHVHHWRVRRSGVSLLASCSGQRRLDLGAVTAGRARPRVALERLSAGPAGRRGVMWGPWAAALGLALWVCFAG